MLPRAPQVNKVAVEYLLAALNYGCIVSWRLSEPHGRADVEPLLTALARGTSELQLTKNMPANSQQLHRNHVSQLHPRATCHAACRAHAHKVSVTC